MTYQADSDLTARFAGYKMHRDFLGIKCTEAVDPPLLLVSSGAVQPEQMTEHIILSATHVVGDLLAPPFLRGTVRFELLLPGSSARAPSHGINRLNLLF